MRHDQSTVALLADEALKLSGSKQRYSGIVTGVDFPAGTTVFIRSGDRQFLAFQDRQNPIVIGQTVSFRAGQFRAKDIEIIQKENQ